MIFHKKFSSLSAALMSSRPVFIRFSYYICFFSQSCVQQKHDAYDSNIDDVNFCLAHKVSMRLVSGQHIFHAVKIDEIAHLMI
jgi:hypothetical protein